MATSEPVTILLVEDDPGHARLIEKSLRRSHVTNELHRFDNGQAVIQYLFRDLDDSTDEPGNPLLILLDLSLPVLDGFQVLERLKADACTQHIPVIVLTAMDVPDQVDRCYALGCNIYLTKPVCYDEFVQAVEKLGFFLSIVNAPTGQQRTLIS